MQWRAGIRSASAIVLGLGCALVSAGCHRAKHYDTNIEVTRIQPVRKDETGKVLTVDFEVSYFECPGTQLEVLRGDAAFAACVSKFKVGEKLKVGLDHVWDDGYYKWNVKKVGDCDRVQDPNDEASYAMVRECDDWLVNGTRVGFQCKYLPEKKLTDKCPWFRRH